MRVVVLGGTGMLGSMLVDVLSGDPNLTVTATAQSDSQLEWARARAPSVDWRPFRVAAGSPPGALASLGPAEWYLNAIGLTKPYIHDDNLGEVRNAMLVNAQWPLELAEFAGEHNASVLQIGTDCVYSGVKGDYAENEPHDATDAYGKTKSLGEAPHPAMHILRSSIVGPEPEDNAFLLAWLLGQPANATVKGFVNHRWNGVTTLHFARVAHGIITNGLSLPRIHHLIPADTVTKARLLENFRDNFGRRDIAVTPTVAATVVDRTLRTINPDLNTQLWQLAGYALPATIAQMVAELAQYPYKFAQPVST